MLNAQSKNIYTLTMASSSINTIILILTLSSFIFVYEVEAFSSLRLHEVYIFSDLSNETRPLAVHCRSKDDDLGNHTLRSGQEFDWHFRTNFLGTTLYSCDFVWGLKKKGMVVFDAQWVGIFHTYNYVVRPEGFYVGHAQTNRMANATFSQKWD